MISAADWRMFGSHVHFQAHKQLMVFPFGEGDQYTNCATQCSVNQAFAATRDQRGFLYGINLIEKSNKFRVKVTIFKIHGNN